MAWSSPRRRKLDAFTCLTGIEMRSTLRAPIYCGLVVRCMRYRKLNRWRSKGWATGCTAIVSRAIEKKTYHAAERKNCKQLANQPPLQVLRSGGEPMRILQE